MKNKTQDIMNLFTDATVYKYVWRILRCRFYIKFSGVDDNTERVCLSYALAFLQNVKRHDSTELHQLITTAIKAKKTKDYSDIKSMWSVVFNEHHNCPACGRHGQLKWRARTKDYRCDFCGMVFDA